TGKPATGKPATGKPATGKPATGKPATDNKEKKVKKHFNHGKKSRSKVRKQKIHEHQVAVHDTFKKTMASIASDSKSKTKKSRTKQSSESTGENRPVIKVSEYVPVAELAKQMDIPPNSLIAKLMDMGVMVSINKTLDMDTITLLAEELGYDVEPMVEYAEDILKTRDENSVIKANIEERPPVVTVMGHVDHGKTTLLDYIREANVVSDESGGITQHIGAYSVKLPDGHKISFIDTPGHEAFTAMRARGASVTDIVILVVAADDSVMPQTIEAINHAKAANIPIIIAINKIDLANADPEQIKGDLSRHNILVEDWGGNYQCQEISAKNGKNVDKLLEKILLESEMLELKADSLKNASGIIIDSKLDKGRGPVATILVQSGVLKIGDAFITGMTTGRVRAMHDEYGIPFESAGPSVPVQIFGMKGVPSSGDTFYVIDSENEAREIANQRRIMKREQESNRNKGVTLEDVFDKIKDGYIKELNLIIKADVDGSMDVLAESLSKITHDEVRVKVIHKGVGGINEHDVLLAAASGAIIMGFHVRPTSLARDLAESEKVEIKLYKVIYEAIEDVEKALSGMLTPTIKEIIVGTAEVRDVFKIPKVGNIAGCYITKGNFKRNAKIKLIRDSIEIYESKISTLKRFKDDVAEVNQGYECGLSIEGYDDIKVGDIIEVIDYQEEARKI
ncbi:MAG: translation initiation factor IF-2, partial [Candidatus Latescibacteria bacterium]|nr:translation initiation factor IF-2 [Candidatus Latescibacterota bacterium]